MDWNLILGIASAVQTVAIAYVGMKTAKIDKLQEQLEAKAGEIIDARMQVLEARMQVSIRSLEQLVGQMQDRLNDGNEHFDAVDEKNQKLELKTQAMVNDLDKRLSVQMAAMATKEDVASLSARFSAFEVAIAKHIARSNN